MTHDQLFNLMPRISSLLSAIAVSTTAASQGIEPEPSAAPSGHTHPRLDPKHLWHLDLPSKLMSQGQFGTCLVRFQVDPDGGIRVAHSSIYGISDVGSGVCAEHPAPDAFADDRPRSTYYRAGHLADKHEC